MILKFLLKGLCLVKQKEREREQSIVSIRSIALGICVCGRGCVYLFVYVGSVGRKGIEFFWDCSVGMNYMMKTAILISFVFYFSST